MHIPIVVALRRRYLVWLYKLAIHLQSFPHHIEIENTTQKGRQYTFRFFIGLLSDQNNSGNFDFGISRVNDYSFKYNFFRSF